MFYRSWIPRMTFRAPQDVVLTSIQRHLNVMRYGRQMDVETTLCAYLVRAPRPMHQGVEYVSS